ncbi:MAG: acyl--CoA ligase [Clostridia bacterium]|nr:acyl--CoA ligase [Clostridia bacterium]
MSQAVSSEALPTAQKPWMGFWGSDIPSPKDAECTVYEYIQRKTVGLDHHIALNYFGTKITYGELKKNVDLTAKAYQKLGLKAGDIVTVCSVMTPETVYSFYALDMLGVTLNMADPRTSSHGLREYIEEVHSKVVVALSVVYDKIKKAVEGTEVEHVIVISPADSLPPVKKFAYGLKEKKPKYQSNVLSWHDFIQSAQGASPVEPVPYSPDRAIVIMHTGGTTGKPKGVLLGDRAVNSLALQYLFKTGGEPGQRFLNVMPPFIAYGYGLGIHAPLSSGMEIILIPQFDPKKFGRLLMKYRAEHTAGVPMHYQNMLTDKKLKNAKMPFLITTGCGGDGISALDEDLVNEFFKAHKVPFPLCKGYGMTEVMAAATRNFENHNRRGSVGIPMVLTNVGIFKPGTDEELGFETEGEVCICSPTMMMGYYGMPNETAAVIRQHRDGQMWVHTGDLGRMDKEGFVYIANRIKRIIIRHDGFKIFPYIIENKILSVEGIEAVCAVAVQDPEHKQGKLPFVFLKTNADFNGNQAELQQKIQDICVADLPEYMQPLGFRFVDEMPRTTVGKLDYLSLEKQAKKLFEENK